MVWFESLFLYKKNKITKQKFKNQHMYEKYIYKSGKSSKISKYCTFFILFFCKHPPLIYMKIKFKCGSDKASHINEVVINVW